MKRYLRNLTVTILAVTMAISFGGNTAFAATDAMQKTPAGTTTSATSKYTYISKKGTVYATTPVHVRTEPSVVGTVLWTAKEGDALQMTAVCEDSGWTRVAGGYVATEFVTETAPEIYTYSEKDEDVYTTVRLHVRDLPSIDGNIVRTAAWGEKLHATGICNETGWTRIDDGYVSSNYISSEKPIPVPTKPAAKQETAVSSDNAQTTTPSQDTSAQNSGSGIRYYWTTNGTTQAEQDAGNMITNGYSYYYAADIRNHYEKEIASLVPGDIISVNGQLVQIDGEIHRNYNYGSVEDYIAAAGGPRPCFQTCEPPYGGPIVIKYGHYL